MDRPELLAVCDVLTLKALEQLGKWIVRHERCRHKQWRGRPLFEAHTNWRPDTMMITKSLRGAWDLVPVILSRWDGAPLSDEEMMNALDLYVHHLAVTGTAHTLERLEAHLQRPTTTRSNVGVL